MGPFATIYFHERLVADVFQNNFMKSERFAVFPNHATFVESKLVTNYTFVIYLGARLNYL